MNVYVSERVDIIEPPSRPPTQSGPRRRPHGYPNVLWGSRRVSANTKAERVVECKRPDGADGKKREWRHERARKSEPSV